MIAPESHEHPSDAAPPAPESTKPGKRGPRLAAILFLIIALLSVLPAAGSFVTAFLLRLRLSANAELWDVVETAEVTTPVMWVIAAVLALTALVLARCCRPRILLTFAALVLVLSYLTMLAATIALLTSYPLRQRLASCLCRSEGEMLFRCSAYPDAGVDLADAIGPAVVTITKRLDPQASGCAVVRSQGADIISVSLDKRRFGDSDISVIVSQIARPGRLEFRVLPTTDQADLAGARIQVYQDSLHKRGPAPTDANAEYLWKPVHSPEDFVVPNAILGRFGGRMYVLTSNRPDETMLYTTGPDGWHVAEARPTRDGFGRAAIGFKLDAKGTVRFAKLTRVNINRPLCILVDNMALSAPIIEDSIYGEGVIAGDYTNTEMIQLVVILRFPPLPIKLQRIQ